MIKKLYQTIKKTFSWKDNNEKKIQLIKWETRLINNEVEYDNINNSIPGVIPQVGSSEDGVRRSIVRV